MILDGAALAKTEKQKLAKYIQEKGLKPGLATILVGDDPASQVYVRSKIKSCNEIGIFSYPCHFPTNTTEKELLKCIEDLNQNPEIHGILVQLPLPNHINQKAIIEAISPKKDVDGFHPYNVGNFFAGLSEVSPCTPAGIIELIDLIPNYTVKGKNALVIGASNIVGKPVAHMLLQKGATIAIAHKLTKNLKELTLWADIIVSATGVPHLIKGDMVKDEVVILDVGIHRSEDGIRGDCDFMALKDKVTAITPVPGGVGPMTILHLLKNTIQLAQQ